MSEELEKLKSIGAQKIYEDTHIPVLHVKAILEHDFDSFLRVQFVGFISILEREYSLDLSSLKASGIAHFDDKDAMDIDESLIVIPKTKKNSNAVYFIIAIVIVIVVVMYQIGYFGESKTQEEPLDDALIEQVQETIKPEIVVEEINTTSDSNLTQNIVEIPEIIEEVPKSFMIRTKSKVWFGYIDVETNEKKQKTFKGEMDLDPEKKWLLIFGHGYIDMFINGEVVKMSSRDNIRYLYEDSTLKAISLKEFKKLNRGLKW